MSETIKETIDATVSDTNELVAAVQKKLTAIGRDGIMSLIAFIGSLKNSGDPGVVVIAELACVGLSVSLTTHPTVTGKINEEAKQ